MDLVVINGASGIARGVTRSLLKQSSYSRVRLLDPRPYRKSVYELQRGLGVPVEKQQVQNAASLELALEGAKHVVYFTHDYLAMTADKNNFIKASAKLAKKQGVEKLVAVCPIEHEMFYSEDDSNAVTKRQEAQQEALSQMGQNLTALDANLVFGNESYLIHYMTQCVLAGRIPFHLYNPKATFKFNPIHVDDIASAVKQQLNASSEASQKYSLNGSSQYSLYEIAGVLAQSCGKTPKAYKTFLDLSLSDFVEEFFTGVAHDKNMVKLAKHFEREPGLRHQLLDNDYFAKKGGQPQVSLEQHYAKQVSEKDVVFPLFSRYKMVSLD